MPGDRSVANAARHQASHTRWHEAAQVLIDDIALVNLELMDQEELLVLVKRFPGVWKNLSQLDRGEMAESGVATVQQQRLLEFCAARVRAVTVCLRRAVSANDFISQTKGWSSRVHVLAMWTYFYGTDDGTKAAWWHGGLLLAGSGFPLKPDAERSIRSALIDLDMASLNAESDRTASAQVVGALAAKAAKGMLRQPLAQHDMLERFAATDQLSAADELLIEALVNASKPSADGCYEYDGNSPPLPPSDWAADAQPCALHELELPLDTSEGPIAGVPSGVLPGTGSVELMLYDPSSASGFQDYMELLRDGVSIEQTMLAAHETRKLKTCILQGGTVRNRNGGGNLALRLVEPRGEHPPNADRVKVRAMLAARHASLRPLLSVADLLDCKHGNWTIELCFYRSARLPPGHFSALHRDILRALYCGFHYGGTVKAREARYRFAIQVSACCFVTLTERRTIRKEYDGWTPEQQLLDAGCVVSARTLSAAEELQGSANFVFVAPRVQQASAEQPQRFGAYEVDDDGDADKPRPDDALEGLLCKWSEPDGWGDEHDVSESQSARLRVVAEVLRRPLVGIATPVSNLGATSSLLHGSLRPTQEMVDRSSLAPAASGAAAAAAVEVGGPDAMAAEPQQPRHSRSSAAAAAAASAAAALQSVSVSAAQPDAAASPASVVAASEAIAMEALLGMPTAAAASAAAGSRRVGGDIASTGILRMPTAAAESAAAESAAAGSSAKRSAPDDPDHPRQRVTRSRSHNVGTSGQPM